MQDLKMTDQCARYEIAGRENASNKQFAVLRSATDVYFDATFKVVPALLLSSDDYSFRTSTQRIRYSTL